MRKWHFFNYYLIHLSNCCLQVTKWPLHTWDLRHVTITLQALLLVEKEELVQFCFTPHLRDQRSKWMQDVRKVYVDSHMASNGSCIMVTWTIFKNRLLEVDLTQNGETMALRNLTTIDSFHFISCEDPACIEIYWNSIWWGPHHIWLHTTLEGPWPHQGRGIIVG